MQGTGRDSVIIVTALCLSILLGSIACIGAVCNALGKGGRFLLLVALAVVAVWFLARS